MLQSIRGNRDRLRLTFLVVLGTCLFGCATVPDTTVVGDAVLPEYKVGSHRVEEPIDLYIEPRIRSLRRNVTPHSEDKAFNAIPVIVGPVLETALLRVTQQHFSQATPVNAPDGRPTLSYKLLDYRPIVSVVPGFFSTRLNVSARLALQVSIHAASGEQLFSTTAIGTSHVSDMEIAAGDGLKDGPRLLEVATRDAITDALYNISSIFGNRSGEINDDVQASATDPGMPVETMDDVVMHLRTWREAESEN
ncbi:MAG: hypothetical protein KJP16_01010 [Gammaproteobacteria bacterium]|nr:hypothetical protein [Gammaproteobacteria bacterium]NNC56572.1 hypothetical protein [Woeseiaceae bacterium]NNL49364.1 hypothetical protein [Woeseiaceae bacterium]